jgi:transposase
MQRIEIELPQDEIKFIHSFLKQGKMSKREYDRANVLLLLHKGKSDTEISDFLDIERTTIWRVRTKYLSVGLEKALAEEPRSGQPIKYPTKSHAKIIALACSDPPSGRAKWTLELLQEKLKSEEGFTTINRESIRLILKKTKVSLG